MKTLSDWLFPNGLMPHGFCYQWNPEGTKLLVTIPLGKSASEDVPRSDAQCA
jgi:hypothetical protein